MSLKLSCKHYEIRVTLYRRITIHPTSTYRHIPGWIGVHKTSHNLSVRREYANAKTDHIEPDTGYRRRRRVQLFAAINNATQL